MYLFDLTGLDPAEPHFQSTDPVVRLDPTDALFVDIIHSDATPFIKGGKFVINVTNSCVQK